MTSGFRSFYTSLTFFVLAMVGAQAQVHVSGKVVDEETQEPLIGVSIAVKGKIIGTVTDINGVFALKVSSPPPITLVFSMVGFEGQEQKIETQRVQTLTIGLKESVILGQEIVISASRVAESVMRSSVSIEKMDILDIQNTPAVTFYEGLNHLKGVDMSAQSFTFKTLNLRGFGSNGNTRFVQLIDGIDNQAPGLNFSVGNILGINDLDMESAELIPGAASALYGPNALNGILLLNSKNPFEYQGLSAYTKLGVNHIDGNDHAPALYQDYGMRYAKAFDDKWAFKITASYIRATDFVAGDYRDRSFTTDGVNNNSSVETTGRLRQNNRTYDGVNVYGDLQIDFPFILSRVRTPKEKELFGLVASLLPTGSEGAFSPTGYTETSFTSRITESFKLGGAIHYRITDEMEAFAQVNWGSGSTVYTANTRFILDNFTVWTAKVELRGTDYYVRAYRTKEGSGDSYDAEALASLINGKYIEDYTRAFLDARGLKAMSITRAHAAARTIADEKQEAYKPGTEAWNVGVDSLKRKSIFDGGAKFKDASSMTHLEGSYNLSKWVGFAEAIVGGNYRIYHLESGGTIFALNSDGSEQEYNDYGGYLQLTKKVWDDRLKIQASGRYDKNKFFKGQFSPRASMVMTVAKHHHLRGSYQRAFRLPTNENLFIDLDAGVRRLVGSSELLKNRYGFKTNTVYSAASWHAAQAALAKGNEQEATQLLVTPKQVLNKLNTEKVRTFELGYRGLWLQSKLMVDAYYYHSAYQDFIANIDIIQAIDVSDKVAKDGFRPAPNFDPRTDEGKRAIIKNKILGGDGKTIGKVQRYGVSVNADGDIKTHGWGLQLDYTLGKGYTAGANVSFNKLLDDQELRKQGFSSQYNTPEYRYNISVGNRNVAKDIGFKVNWKWQQAFLWESPFGRAVIPAFGTLDAQVSYKVASLKSVVRVGGNNILNQRYTTSFGNPTIGALYYLSLTFDQFLN